MDREYVQLTQAEEMWARMLMEVLEDNRIPCTAIPLFGAGFTLKTGMQEQLRIFVPVRYLCAARELMQSLFDAEPLPESP